MMKTISLEVEESIYPNIVSFLRLLPSNSVHVLEDDSDTLSAEERIAVANIQARLQAGDDSEFEDWDSVKADIQ
jgi:hypothetical protein